MVTEWLRVCVSPRRQFSSRPGCSSPVPVARARLLIQDTATDDRIRTDRTTRGMNALAMSWVSRAEIPSPCRAETPSPCRAEIPSRRAARPTAHGAGNNPSLRRAARDRNRESSGVHGLVSHSSHGQTAHGNTRGQTAHGNTHGPVNRTTRGPGSTIPAGRTIRTTRSIRMTRKTRAMTIPVRRWVNHRREAAAVAVAAVAAAVARLSACRASGRRRSPRCNCRTN